MPEVALETAAFGAELLRDRQQRLAQMTEVLGGHAVDEVPAYGVDMVRCDAAHRLPAVLGQHGEEPALVGLAVLPADQVRLLHARDLVREAALGLERGGREV